MTVRRLVPTDAADYRELMLEGYERHPDAFTSSAAERAALRLSWWEARLDASPRADQIVLGAFDGERLVGAAGLQFEPREKARHKANLFGMYVHPTSRQGGFGRELVSAALAFAAARDGVKLVQLTVTEGNVAAQRLYEQCGFVSFGVEPFAVALDGAYLSKVHMWCPVAPLG
ncbi:N-acetyltransferase family protein [Variovorax sp. GT1P44]|uniref:GNAT family N-acetyltransferase n=1 Tax=Variovorax sp. GT1P44 TaxID=3443742 RepID=UPI003F48E89F